VVVRTVTRERTHRTGLQRGLLVGLCTLAACIPDAGNKAPGAPTGFCVRPQALCTPDPGAPPVDCATAEAGLEFAPFMIADFEHLDKDPNGNPAYVGPYMYSYTDATAQVFANGDNGTQFPAGFTPVAETASLCSSDDANHPNHHVLHVSGGPFLGWGGGLGVAMEHINQSDGGYSLGLCDPVQYDFCPPSGSDDVVAITTLDMSNWDGVAVWARRGPDSQPLLRVLVGNKYVDEDVSFLEYGEDPTRPRYCERVRECDCVNGKACNYWNGGGSDVGTAFATGYYCGDPAADPIPGTISGNGVQATNSCNATQCNQPYPAYATMYPDFSRCNKPIDPVKCPDATLSPPMGTDPQFYNRPCTPHAFRNGGQGSYCFDPARDPPPAESDQQCGDYWTFPLHLTTEWQLFLVPFTTMYQQGWAKRWPFFDTSSVSVVRLTWDAGWIDYWIDNLRFYRVRR
jgi:hypothetical protein